MESKENKQHHHHVTEETAGVLVSEEDFNSKRKLKVIASGGMRRSSSSTSTTLLLVGSNNNNKRGGPSTPSPTWKLHFTSSLLVPDDINGSNNNNPVHEFFNNTTNSVSARKLCANLWQNQPQQHRQDGTFGPCKKGKVKDFQVKTPFVGRSQSSSDHHQNHQSAGVSTAKRRVARSARQPHHSVDDSDHVLHNQAPANCDSLVEVAPYKIALSPTSSSEIKGKKHEPNQGLKTSTELLKVLNRIWSLEEQQASNILLLKALKSELNQSRSRIKDLLKEKQLSKQVVDGIKKQVAEDKVFKKTKEHGQIKAAIQTLQKELDYEKRMRKNSQSQHWQLAQELSKLKLSFSNALKELERERQARKLLEKLCDEFAKGIKEYERQVRSLKHKPQVDRFGNERPDHMILHISEAWLDERMQMKLVNDQNDQKEKTTIVDKLALDIETFLRARNSNGLRRGRSLSATAARKHCSRRESFPLKDATSAPQYAIDGEDATDSDSHCFELSKSTTKRHSMDGLKPHGRTVQTEIGEVEHEGYHLPTSKNIGLHRLNLKNMPNNLIRNYSLSSEGDKIFPEDICTNQPVFRGHASPVQKWNSTLTSPEFNRSETSLRSQRSMKESSLKSKLLEARLEDQRYRLRASKASF